MSRPHSNFKYTARRIPPFILFVLKHVGVSISPFVTVREKNDPPDKDQPEKRFTMGFLNDTQIDEIQKVEPASNRDEITRWFRQGKLCFGVRDGSRLIAKMWCDLEALHYAPAYRLLEPDEAYLYAACVQNEYRGESIAPMMRVACCARLREMGRTKFLSYTDYFNYAARRFKKKMGAEYELLGLHVALFGRWSRTWILKRYD
jgi:ribosomal protein S18 acetylase RimI-like enzyme